MLPALTSCSYTESLKLKHNHVYVVFTQLDILFEGYISSDSMRCESSVQLCAWTESHLLNIPLCTLLRILFVNMLNGVHQCEYTKKKKKNTLVKLS